MHPKAMRQYIADFLSKKYGFKSTAGTILLKRDELETATPISDAKRIWQSAYPQLNQALNIQIMDLNSANISPRRGQAFHRQAQCSKWFQFSVGWVAGLTRNVTGLRHKVCQVNLRVQMCLASCCGEVWESIRNATRPFNMDDVCNFDETGLFFRLEPQKTLASKPVKGKRGTKTAFL